MSILNILTSLKRIQQDLHEETEQIDIESFEGKLREIINELSSKRMQVDYLKKELDEANIQIHELTRNMDHLKTTLIEKEFNFEVAIQNNKNLGEKLQEHLDFSTKTKMQYESAILENKNLRELLQELEFKNNELSKKLNEENLKNRDDMFQNTLFDNSSEIESNIQELANFVAEIEKRQIELSNQYDKLNVYENFMYKVEFYQNELIRYKKENRSLETKYISSKATADKLHQYIKDSSLLSNYENSKHMIDEWKTYNENLKLEIVQLQKLIADLTVKLKHKETSCKQLTDWHTSLEEQINNYKEKLESYESKTYEIASVQTDKIEMIDVAIDVDVTEN